jgi:hypothetical protein
LFSNNRKVQRARPLGGLEQAKAVIRNNEHGVSHGNDRLLVSAMSHNASVACRKRAARRPHRSQCRFDQGAAEPDVAIARFRRFVLARTLMIARAQAGPAGEMSVTGKARHVEPDLGDEHLGG